MNHVCVESSSRALYPPHIYRYIYTKEYYSTAALASEFKGGKVSIKSEKNA